MFPLAALASLALAAPAAAQAPVLALSVPAGPGQQALALRAEGGAVRARVCASATGCAPDGGALLPLPEDARPLLGKARATVLTLAGGRAVARVELPGEAPEAAWVMILAAPLAGKGSEPLIVWSGWTGVSRGEHGEERSAAVLTEPVAGGATRVLVGERRADVAVCGRPTLVGAREIDPGTLALGRAASVQNLGAAERAAATRLVATRAPGAATPAGEVRLLRATAASSAVEKKFATLTDGDPATAWSENRTGDGRGEFVSMATAPEVGITSFDLVVRPTEDVPDGAAPKRIYLAATGALFEVTLPEDAWQKPPGTRYGVKLPAELHTSCLAVVLDEAFAPAGKAGARVTLAEIEAHTAFDAATPEALAGALAGGGERSRAAAALLARAGGAGVKAAMGVYEKLDDEGKLLAASVIDAAPCAEQVPFFAERFAAASAAPAKTRPAPGEVDPELLHARDRLRRCGRAAAPALARMVADGAAATTRIAAADELSVLAPVEAVPVLIEALARLGAADDAVRRELRAALARAAKNPRALPALREEVARPRLDARSETVAIDLLRAIGPSLGRVDGASEAFAAVAARSTSFRSRYLLQAPAAELAKAGDRRAEGYLRDALRKDEDVHVRVRAAELSGDVPALVTELLAAFDDGEVRVREAAINAFADAQAHGGQPEGLTAALGKRLAKDDWTFIRAGSARALGMLPAAADVDAVLAGALADGASEVRGRALDGLGAHHAVAHVEAIRARQDDAAEDVEVRARAILALGSLCDRKSLAQWTKLARAAKTPADDRDKRLGGAAIAALGEVHPADLAERLAPLAEKDAPQVLREMVKVALAGQSSCK
jgi:hypothetical protein